MKRFIVISIVMLSAGISAWGCIWLGHSHNNFLFSVFRREMMTSDLFTQEINEFWKTYSNGEIDQYRWNEKILTDLAKKKNDNEMVDYLEQLNIYLDISQQLAETWDYPTKEQLQQRRQNLNNMIAKAKAYKGTRLRPRWQLLQMRANMVLGNHAENINLWEQQNSKTGASVYREMMRNIYAGALLNQGRRTEACNIFADQGDMVSIKWAMRKHRNLAGIKAIFAESADSPTMNFLVQDFVNNTQESIDSDGDKEWVEDMLDRRVILRNEANQFITYARSLVDGKKTKSPALWMAAIGELQLLFGQYDEAMATLNKAVDMEGTQRMKDNARAIRLVASPNQSTLAPQYNSWVKGELDWLFAKIKEEAGNDSNKYYDNHYYDVLERFVYCNLAPRYMRNGNTNMAAALINMMECGKVFEPGTTFDNGQHLSYYNEFFTILDTMTIQQAIDYQQFINKGSNDPLEKMVKSKNNINNDYLNDIIGTRFLANGQFDKAIEYLNKVPLSFMEKQNISYYLANRDFTKPCWTERQYCSNEENCDGPDLGKITFNKKLVFCREMSQLEQRYKLANNQERPKVAYDLAVRYYQASYYGDCWFLSQYGKSVCDTARTDRPDFVGKAIQLLEESARSTDPTVCFNSLYALAYIPVEPWCTTDYNWSTNTAIIIPIRGNRQWRALNTLNNYVKGRAQQNFPLYLRRCDVLKKFRQSI